MRSRDLTLSHDLVAEGAFHRCVASNKRNAGSYVLNIGLIPWGAYNNWTDGKQWSGWRLKSTERSLSYLEQREIERIKREQQEIRRRAHEHARLRATRLWIKLPDASNQHRYLISKHIRAWGIRRYGSALVIPIYDRNNELMSLQLIYPNGRKLYWRGGQVAGGFFFIEPTGWDHGHAICVAEGYATARSVRKATGHGTYCAFNAGNLTAVAEIAVNGIRQRRSLYAATTIGRRAVIPV
jgi:putative DNA primase/helicase